MSLFQTPPPNDLLTFRVLFQRWAGLIVSNLDTPTKSSMPLIHVSESAHQMLEGSSIIMKRWENYPEPPESFLDLPIPLDRFYAPSLQAIWTPWWEVDKIEPSEQGCQRLLITAINRFQQALDNVLELQPTLAGSDWRVTTQSKNGSGTVSDIGLSHPKGQPVAAIELKVPVSGKTPSFNDKLDYLYDKPGLTYKEPTSEETTATSRALVIQLFEYCSQSNLHLSALTAPPLAFRVGYMPTPTEDMDHVTAHLTKNLVAAHWPDSKPSVLAIHSEILWENFLRQLMWFTLILLVRESPDVQRAMKAKGLETVVDEACKPHEGESHQSHLGRALTSLQSARFMIKQLAWSSAFRCLRARNILSFIYSFKTSPVSVESVITYPKKCTSFLNALFIPDSISKRAQSIVCLYRRWGFVVKYFLNTEAYDVERRAYEGLSAMERIPSLIARGLTTSNSTPNSIPFLVITYHGVSPPELTKHDVAEIYSQIIKPMHARGWHHHDIKCDNVTRHYDGKLYLIDFNFAVPASECLNEEYCEDLNFVEEEG